MAQPWQVDPGPLEAATRALSGAAQQARGGGFSIALASRRMLDAWEGDGASAFDSRSAPLRERAADLDALLSEATAVLRSYTSELHEARAMRTRAAHAAAGAGIVLDASGTARVAPGTRDPGIADLLGAVARQAATASDLAEQAHVRAAMHLERLARQALRLALREDVDVARATATGWLSVLPIPGIPPPAVPTNRDPDAIARWWQALTPAQRVALLHANPALVGRLGGIPSAWRDWANRLTLQRILLGPLSTSPDPAEVTRLAATTPAWHLWHNLTAISRESGFRLRPDDVYLLSYDLDVPGGRAVIALGNPATARHVGVVVPGTGNHLGNVANPLRDAARLRASVDDLPPPRMLAETSTVMWLGYETPMGLIDAAGKNEAEAGAPALRGFVDELRDTHEGNTHPHLSVFGHSYGSTLVGTAATQELAADDVILFGSPGAGADHASELSIPQGHVWATRTQDDPITRGIPFAALDRDPMDQDFGAHRFAVAPAPIQSGHSEYYKPQTLGIENFARIMIGRYGKVQ